jgi:hypothetical protein
MSELPRSLKCLTLAHVLDDPDAVEGLLAQDPDTESCIPIALRTMLETDELPPVPYFSAEQLLKYLNLLWASTLVRATSTTVPSYRRYITVHNTELDMKFNNAIIENLIYLVAYYLRSGASVHTCYNRPLNMAVRFGHNDMVRFLIAHNANPKMIATEFLKAAKREYPETIKLLNSYLHR